MRPLRCETWRSFSFVVRYERPSNDTLYEIRIIWSHFVKMNVTGQWYN
nr:MAG TPA: hypothetical protein [Caudoviricetes sp.]